MFLRIWKESKMKNNNKNMKNVKTKKELYKCYITIYDYLRLRLQVIQVVFNNTVIIILIIWV